MTVCLCSHHTADSVVTEPAELPVTLCQAKHQIMRNSLPPDQEQHLLKLVASATQRVEQLQRSALINTTRLMSARFFPRNADHYQFRGFYGPTQAVTEVKYIDRDGNEVVLDPSWYVFDDKAMHAVLEPADGYDWPTDERGQPNDVQVTYTAGYGATEADVPARIQCVILQMVQMAWDQGVMCCDCDGLENQIAMDAFDVWYC